MKPSNFISGQRTDSAMVSDKKNLSPSSSRMLNSPPAEETTPLIDNTKPLSSHPKTLANVFIAIVGAGVLGMPYAFKRTGWIMGLLILSFIAASTTYCMTLLVQIRRKLDSYDNGTTNISSFGDLGFAVCGTFGRFSCCFNYAFLNSFLIWIVFAFFC